MCMLNQCQLCRSLSSGLENDIIAEQAKASNTPARKWQIGKNYVLLLADKLSGTSTLNNVTTNSQKRRPTQHWPICLY